MEDFSVDMLIWLLKNLIEGLHSGIPHPLLILGYMGYCEQKSTIIAYLFSELLHGYMHRNFNVHCNNCSVHEV